jgi:hypothetical protein
VDILKHVVSLGTKFVQEVRIKKEKKKEKEVRQTILYYICLAEIIVSRLALEFVFIQSTCVNI